MYCEFMLKISTIKRGEGVHEAFNLEIGCAHWREIMEDEYYQGEYEKAFHKAFYQMADKVEKLFADYQERLEKKKMKEEKAENNDLMKQGKQGDPHEPPSPYSSSSSSSCSSSHILVLVRNMFLKSHYLN